MAANPTDTTQHEEAAEVAQEDQPSAVAAQQPEEEAAETELAQLREELGRAQDEAKRQAAELQNFRRRTQREEARRLEYVRGDVVRPFLDVMDDLERALVAAEEAAGEEETEREQGLREGVRAVYQKMLGVLEGLDVQPIEAVGEPFDEEEHEALMQAPASDDHPSGTVTQELQRGYRMGEHVLRHSRVIVAQ